MNLLKHIAAFKMEQFMRSVEAEITSLRAENERLREARDLAVASLDREQERNASLTADHIRLRAENERRRKALREWDALIRHQYSGSREAMSDMVEAAQNTAQLLYGDPPWPEPTVIKGDSNE